MRAGCIAACVPNGPSCAWKSSSAVTAPEDAFTPMAAGSVFAQFVDDENDDGDHHALVVAANNPAAGSNSAAAFGWVFSHWTLNAACAA